MTLRFGLALVFVALSAPATAADSTVGRLFFTPSQRASLDVARSQRTRVTVATERTEELLQPAPQTITYGGMIRRSDGQTTVWLNNRRVDESRPAAGSTIVRQVRPNGAVTLEVPQSNRRVDLKVGQSVEVLSGSIGEGYARSTLAPKPDATIESSSTGSPNNNSQGTGAVAGGSGSAPETPKRSNAVEGNSTGAGPPSSRN